MASSHKFSSNFFDSNIQVVISLRDRFFLFATPQQNGVAERKNQSLKEMTTCILESKKLAENLWDEAMNAAAYI